MEATAGRKGLTVRKLADKSGGVSKYDHATGEVKLVNPDGGSWPFLGLMFVEPAPQLTRIPMSWVSRGVVEKFVTLENERVVYAPGAPPQGQGKHTFVNADFLNIHTVEGTARYKVTHQPGKYGDVVDWFFDAELVTAPESRLT